MTRRSASCTKANDGSSKFVFDLMEPERPKVDRVVLDFVKGNVFEAGDIVLLYGDESEALTHPYLACAWAKSGADLRVRGGKGDRWGDTAGSRIASAERDCKREKRTAAQDLTA